MRNRGLSLIVVALVALAGHAKTQHVPRGTAADGSRAEVEATVEKTASAAVIGGKAALATGGTIENARESAPDTTVIKVLNGPSTPEGVVQNGTSREVGPGDVVIIPPNTPHWSSGTESPQIACLVVRVDPHKVVPAGYGAK